MQDTQHQKPQFGFTKSGVIVLRHVRVLFFALYKPAPDQSGRETYNITCEISPEQLKFLEEEMKKVAQERWTDRASAMWPKLNKGAREHTPEKGAPYLMIRASNNVVDRKGNPIPAPALYTSKKQKSEIGGPDEIYAGCYVNLYVTPGAYDKGSIGVKFYIRAVHFVEEGPRLGGGSVESDDLDDLADDDDDNFDPESASW